MVFQPGVLAVLLIFIHCLQTVGYYSVIYLASIISINPELFEVAKLEGASKIQQITKITIPLIKPVMIMLIMFGIGKIFYSDFGLFYHVPLNSGLLYSTTNTIDTYVYRALTELNDFSMSAAAGFYQSIVGFILVFTANMIIRKINPENAMF